jgi:hypothetical protein
MAHFDGETVVVKNVGRPFRPAESCVQVSLLTGRDKVVGSAAELAGIDSPLRARCALIARQAGW